MKEKDPNAPLRDNVKRLGELLGQTLKDQIGESLYQTVESIRLLSKEAHEKDAMKDDALIEQLQSLSPERMLAVIRAFSHFLNLVNIAESHHRLRRTRWHDRFKPNKPHKGSLKWCFKKSHSDQISPEMIKEAVLACQLELVLTAHPTEVLRRTLIQKFDKIRDTLSELDREDLTPNEIKRHQTILRREITSIWLTDEIRRRRPSPVDESKWGFAIIENSLWDAYPEFMRTLESEFYEYTQSILPMEAVPIRFGSWMGGDRDGNPNVTHEVTHEICLLARWNAALLYEEAVHQISADLSMTECSSTLRRYAKDSQEPYRFILNPLREKLKSTIRGLEEQIASGKSHSNIMNDIKEILDPLMLCYQSLKEVGADIIADGPLKDLIRRCHCFGLTLTRLDIRQESSVHHEVMQAVFKQLGIQTKNMDEKAHTQLLIQICTNPKKYKIDETLLLGMNLEVWRTIQLIRQQPDEAFGAYVISMAHGPIDVLNVLALQKLIGVEKPLRIVPLFERLEDLNKAGESLEALLSLPIYRNLIQNRQEVMIGYSDSAKGAGILAANWAIYQAQEDLVQVAQKHGVYLTLFHGRGGTVSRGGSPAHMAILSQPPGAVHGSLRITEQGEVVRNKFGFAKTAIRTLELYASAMIEAYCKKPPEPKPSWRSLMTQIADHSESFYRNMVIDDPKFFEYFNAVTPIHEIGQLFIGSRPYQRGQKKGLQDLRAIPWVFAWMQNRSMVSSWLGIGEVLSHLSAEELSQVKIMANEWPFFKALISMIEMVLAKADPRISMHYELRLANKRTLEIGSKLRQEFTTTLKMIKTILETDKLLLSNPTLERSLKVRSPYLYPINVLQAELIRRVRQEKSLEEPYLDALLISISGIAAGMRNTG